MNPSSVTTISTSQPEFEDKSKKALQNLQSATKDKENLVKGGRVLRSASSGKVPFRDEMSEKIAKATAAKDKKTKKVTQKEKPTRTTGKIPKVKIEIEDLTSEAGPSKNYWQVLAERRRIALDQVLEENKVLHEKIARLEEEKEVYKEMLDETRALVEVFKDIVNEDNNDASEDDSNDINNSVYD